MKAVRIEVLAVYAGMLLIGHSAFGQDGEAERLLADGDKLAWLKNWQAAEPFFEKAEILFRERGDKRNELYARISRMRGQLPSRGLFETSTYLASVLDDPLTKDDARLRLRCLTVREMSIWISIQLSPRAIGRKRCRLRRASRIQRGSIAQMASSESSASFRAIIGAEQ